MNTFKKYQMSHLSIVNNSLSANKSISLRLLTGVLISVTIVLMGKAFAADGSNDPNNNIAGLYVGVLGSEYPEPFTLQLSKTKIS